MLVWVPTGPRCLEVGELLRLARGLRGCWVSTLPRVNILLVGGLCGHNHTVDGKGERGVLNTTPASPFPALQLTAISVAVLSIWNL